MNGDPVDDVDSLGLRPLTSGEIAMLSPIFNGTVDFSSVDIESGSAGDFRATIGLAAGNAVTINNTIHFPSSQYLSDFSQGGLSDQAWLAHEMTHVFQHQNEPGYSYRKAFDEWVKYGSKHEYDYSLSEHACFYDYRYEQQAAIVHDYYAALAQGGGVSGFESLLNPVGLGVKH